MILCFFEKVGGEEGKFKKVAKDVTETIVNAIFKKNPCPYGIYSGVVDSSLTQTIRSRIQSVALRRKPYRRFWHILIFMSYSAR